MSSPAFICWISKIRHLALALSLTLCFFAAPAIASPARQIVLPADFSGSVDLDDAMSVLLDPSRATTLEDILQGRPGRFSRHAGKGINLGYTRTAAWTRFIVSSARGEQDVVLWMTPAFTDLIDVYVASDSRTDAVRDFQHFALGDNRALPSDGNSSLGYGVPLRITQEPAVIYIRAASIDSSLNLSVQIHHYSEHLFRASLKSLLTGLWFGGMTVLLAIQFVFFYYRRRAVYWLLGLATLGTMLVYMGNMGVSRFLLFRGGGIGNDLFTATAVWFGMLATCLATRHILDLPKRAPLSSKIFVWGAMLGAVGMAFALAHKAILFAPWGHAAMLGLSALGLFQSVRIAQSDGSTSRLNAAAYVILGIGLVGTITQRTALLPLPNWVAHSYAVSCLLQTLLLTAALVVQLRAAEAVNQKMSQQALTAALEAQKRAIALVEERTRELAEAKKLAEDALRAELNSQEQQIRFMEVISHQYRTPLATIRSNVDGLGLSLAPSDRSNQQRIDRIRRGISRLVETLELNLDRSRLQGNAFKPQLEATMLGSLIATIGARARDLLPALPIETDIDATAWGTRVNVDKGMLTIAIINLLENAAKYSKPGNDAPIHLRCRCDDRGITITVCDHGIGIPAAMLPTIMDRSVRAANAHMIEGSGIGLSLVSRIVQSLDGDLQIESREHVGTSVHIFMPLRPNRTSAPLPSPAERTAPIAG